MDNAELKRIWQKAYNYANRRGFGDESSDFAQEYAIKYFETGGAVRVEYYFIDYSDKCRASKRVLSSPYGYLSKRVRVSLDQPITTQEDTETTIGDTLGTFRDDVEFNRDTGQNYRLLTGKEAVIWEM